MGRSAGTAAFAYLDRARPRANLTILPDTLVDRILVEEGRVVTERGEFSAGTIVLAAGAYGTPGILLRSDIGKWLPIGENLTDHVGVGMGWEPTTLLQEETDLFAAEHPVFMAEVAVRFLGGNVFLFPAVDPGWEISAAVFAMKPCYRGLLTLTAKNPRAPLHVEHGFLNDARDVDTLVEGAEELQRIAALARVRRYASREIRPGPDVSPQELVRGGARGFFHPVGTCAMGAVVDRRGRLLGTENVVVADASIMPTIPRANTNLTVAAIAERLAETL